ncbi:MAG: cupin [Polyangiaceae bacterium]|nr:cupin [Polyangiaceae bacterium]
MALILADILSPFSESEFFRMVFGRTWLHVRGTEGRFHHLLDWPALNDLLGRASTAKHLRFAVDGRYVDLAKLVQKQVTLPPPHAPSERIDAAALQDLLGRGGTIVVDAVDDLHEPVTRMTERLEAELHESIQANAYVGWARARGYGLHWDDHDVLVLQVRGKKRWRIHPSTKPFPTTDDDSLEPPTGAPAWEGDIADGDVLYIPRGAWHCAEALDEPSIHVTFGIPNRTGLDLVAWMAQRLRASEAFRMDLPRFSSSEERAAHQARLRVAFEELWQPSLIDDFFRAHDRAAVARPRFTLPMSAMAGSLPSEDALVRVVGWRTLELRPDAHGNVEADIAGRRHTFPASIEPILRLLDDKGVCSLGELYAVSNGGTAKHFIRMLMLRGLIAIEEQATEASKS